MNEKFKFIKMKTIGLIGGTTWLSTIDYYRLINQKVNEKLGGESSALILLYSFDFAVMKKLADENNWNEISKKLCNIAPMLERGGADCLLLCANTLHIVAGDVRKIINIPLIHIAEETMLQIKNNGLKKVGLLGTRFTMEGNFFKDELSDNNIETIIPVKEDRDFIHEKIFSELGKGIFTAETKKRYMEIISRLIDKGAEGIILGCTEIPLIIKEEDCTVQIFNTTLIHATAAVEFALSRDN
jgi:aspartate racemase